MKVVSCLIALALLFAGCQKELSTKQSTIAQNIVASDAIISLPYHSISFRSDYPVVPGEVPPFQFTKTLYPDSRVKTISMLSRVNPIYPGYAKQAVELIGTFSYTNGRTDLKGTSEIWEYYKTPSGAGARRSISKKNINWRFFFSESGYCSNVMNLDNFSGVVDVYYSSGDPDHIGGINVYDRVPNTTHYYDSAVYYKPQQDQYGNVLSFTDYGYHQGKNSSVTYAYDYNIPRGSKNYSFIPSQNLFSQSYSLLEVMQWVPQPSHQRKAVAGIFFLPNGSKVTQSQNYYKYQFDAHGNQTSLTYGDNILQKTTWSPN